MIIFPNEKSTNTQSYNFFSFVFKVMEYPQIHTQKFNLKQEKEKDFLCDPLSFWRMVVAVVVGGGGGEGGVAVATPLY